MANDYEKQRKSIRFQPDANTLAYIKRLKNKDSDSIDCVGLVSNEAGKGFGCVSLFENSPSEGEECMVKVGELAAIAAKVVFVKKIDDDAVKLGFEYLE